MAVQRVRFRAKFGFNVDVDFSDSGAALQAHAPGRYLDGYALPDSNTVGTDGLTWNWGYDEANQYDPGAETLTLRSISNSDSLNTNGSRNEDPLPGFELSYIHVMGTIGRAAWGIELAGGYTQLSTSFQRTLMSNVSLQSDVFNLAGVIPPTAPYQGSFDGPGPLIPVAPSGSSTQSALTSIAERQDYEARLIGFRLGPVVDIPIYKNLSTTLGLGLAYTYAEGRFNYSDQAVLPDGSIHVESYRSEENTILFGAYVDAALNYQFTSYFGANVGVQFQYLDDLKQSVGGRDVTLNLGQTLFVTAGVTLAF